MGYDIHMVAAVRSTAVDRFEAALRERDPDEAACVWRTQDRDGHRLYDFGPYCRMPVDDIVNDACWTLDPDDFYLVRVGDDPTDCSVDGNFYEEPFDLCLVRRITYGGQTDVC